jgi:hypothetical protein
MRPISRRDVLKTAAASTVFPLFTVAGTKASGQVIGANEVVRMGVAGVNGRGGSHIEEFTKKDSKAQVTYLIDPDKTLYPDRTDSVKKRGGNTPKCVADIRQALDDKELDAISVATPNHWHSLISIWACQAGKDVYVEKPLSHNLFEGRKLVDAMRKYKRIVQHGTQNRSSVNKAREIAAVQSGKYGKLLVSKGYCCKPRWSIGEKPVESPPESLDFNLWLGPAPEQPFHKNLVHYNWHWFWDFGNGDIGNQGVHEMDIARWAIKDATLPTKVWSLGGRLGYVDQGQTPCMQMSVMEFGETLLVFEVRGLVGKHKEWPNKVGNEFYTSQGIIKDGKFFPKEGGAPFALKDDPNLEAKVAPGGAFGSFINAVRSRKIEECNCDAEVGHYSSALCHLANISYRLGAKDASAAEPYVDLGENKEVRDTYVNLQENLRAVEVDLEKTNFKVGRVLKLDPKLEAFDGDAEANAMLTRSYREPFVVPNQV